MYIDKHTHTHTHTKTGPVALCASVLPPPSSLLSLLWVAMTMAWPMTTPTATVTASGPTHAPVCAGAMQRCAALRLHALGLHAIGSLLPPPSERQHVFIIAVLVQELPHQEGEPNLRSVRSVLPPPSSLLPPQLAASQILAVRKRW